MKKKKLLISVATVLGVVLLCLAVVSVIKANRNIEPQDDKKATGTQSTQSTALPHDFEFFLRWNVYGISSYDSESGQLIKASDTEDTNRFTTELKLSDEQYKEIWSLIEKLDINSYPDTYNPHINGSSAPHMTLTLSIKTAEYEKTVEVPETMLEFKTNNKKGQKFLNTCKGIIDIITSTEEWSALPEYENIYQ